MGEEQGFQGLFRPLQHALESQLQQRLQGSQGDQECDRAWEISYTT